MLNALLHSKRSLLTLCLLASVGLAVGPRRAAAGFDPFASKSAASSASTSVSLPANAPSVQVPVADAPPQSPVGTGSVSFSVNDAPSVKEGTSGAQAKFTVTLSKKYNKSVSVQFKTFDGTAKSGQDYKFTSGTLIFAAGQTSKSVSVSIVNNSEPPNESTEYFYLALENSKGAQIARSIGKATITEQVTPKKIFISVNDAPLAKESYSNSAKFTVYLSEKSTSRITVKYKTGNGSANSVYDYYSTSGQLTFNPGQTSAVVYVPLRDPLNDKSGDKQREDFYLYLFAATGTGAQIGDSQGRVFIDDGRNIQD